MDWLYLVIAAVAACFALSSIPAAEAKGCLKGAAVGAVAGHSCTTTPCSAPSRAALLDTTWL